METSIETLTELRDQIRRILADVLGVDILQVTDNADIIDDLNGDSLDVVEMVTLAEIEFDIGLDDRYLEEIVTVGDPVDLITKAVERARATRVETREAST